MSTESISHFVITIKHELYGEGDVVCCPFFTKTKPLTHTTSFAFCEYCFPQTKAEANLVIFAPTISPSFTTFSHIVCAGCLRCNRFVIMSSSYVSSLWGPYGDPFWCHNSHLVSVSPPGSTPASPSAPRSSPKCQIPTMSSSSTCPAPRPRRPLQMTQPTAKSCPMPPLTSQALVFEGAEWIQMPDQVPAAIARFQMISTNRIQISMNTAMGSLFGIDSYILANILNEAVLFNQWPLSARYCVSSSTYHFGQSIF